MGKISVPAELVQAIDTASAIVLRDVIKTIGAECPDGRVMAKEMLSSAPEHVRKTKRVLANIVMVICEGVGDAKVITERILGINEVKKRNMENIFGGSSAGTGRMDMFTFSDIKRTNQIEVDDVPYSSFAGSVKRRKTSVHGSDSCCEESSTRTKSDHQVANIKPPTFGANSGRDMVTANTSTDSRLQSKRKKTVNEIFAADSQRREAEALMEEQRRRAEIEWSNTRTSCGRCNMQYYPDYNRHGDCVWHSGVLKPYHEWAFKWNCCRRFVDDEGCMQSEHVDASITGVMRTLERKRQEAIDAAEEEGDWESTEDEYCWRNCEDDDAESVFLQEFECHDCGDSYIGREPTPDKDFPGSPECQKCKWKGWNDGWEERGDAELCCFRCTEDREVREVHDSSYYSDVAVCKDCKEELDERTSRNSGTDCASHEPVVALSADCEDGLDQTESEKSGEECTSPESIMVAAREECNEDVDETASENSEKQCA